MITKEEHVCLHSRSGFSHLIALLALTVCSTFALTLATSSTLNLRQSENHQRSVNARLIAESGLAFALNRLGAVRLPGTTTEESLLPDLCQALGDNLNGTANLAGAGVTYADSTVSVPPIALGQGAFSWCVTQTAPDECLLEVLGTVQGVSRRVSLSVELVEASSRAFDFGVASRGQIIVSGNAEIVGINTAIEASILSATTLHEDAIRIDGNVTVSGDLAVAGEDTTVLISGSPSIAGSTDPGVYADHIHFGVDAPDFPALDTAPLAALATNVVDADTNVRTPGQTWDNIRIVAGTNPKFANHQVLNGVIYIEAPNLVRFEGQTTINGMIVTEDSGQNLDDCQLHFAGGVEAYGVETLPETPEFAAVREETGTFILAPGFGLTFAGHVTAVNGCIAADQLTFTGSAEGVVNGTVIGLKDLPTSIGGNVEIYIDRSGVDPDPSGFRKSFALVAQPGSYRENVGQ